MNHSLTDKIIQDIWNEIPAPPAHVETIEEIGPWVESYIVRAAYDVAANKAITEASAMMNALVSDGSIDRKRITI